MLQFESQQIMVTYSLCLTIFLIKKFPAPTHVCVRGRGFAAASALMSGQLVRGRASEVDPKQPSQVYDFYMFLWKIFYASYLFLPLAR